MARKLQHRLALAQFKAKHGWEDLTLDLIEPKVEELQLRRQRPSSSGDVLSDSSSSASEFQYPRQLQSSPLKGPIYSDALGSSSSSSSGHRKRTYNATFQHPSSNNSARKRFRSSPTAGRSLQPSHTAWKDQHQLAQSSPIKPRKQSHFTTSAGPNLSFYRGTSSNIPDPIHTSFGPGSDEEDDLLPIHSFKMPSMEIRSSPPRTPPRRANLGRRSNGKNANGKSGEEGADLLLYLATSPSPANPKARSQMQPPSTPPQRHLALPSSMMTTPGGGNGLLSGFGNPHTPNQGFDFADFVNITPSPAQNAWIKTPGTARTPATVGRRRLTFENFTTASPTIGSHSTSSGTKHTGLGMQLGGELIP